ncbi:MAG: 5-formyltetrahydrofolate cyclo-ligase [Planctomycetota bacterium]
MKARLRKDMQRTLADMPADVAAAKSRAACGKLIALDAFARAEVVMVYLHVPDEVDTTEVALAAWQHDKRVLVPAVDWDTRRMEALELHSLADEHLDEDAYGLRTPAGAAPAHAEIIDLVVVPALAYDRRGNRLGRGAGFYDRFLARADVRAVACGLAFAEQVVESVPVHASDYPVDILVTDTEVMTFPARVERAPAEEPQPTEQDA